MKTAVLAATFVLFLAPIVFSSTPISDKDVEDDGPIADAGPDYTSNEGETLALDGTGSLGSLGREIFLENVRLNEYHPSSSNNVFEPQVAVDSDDNVHIIWSEYAGVDFRANIYYKKSTKGGANLTHDVLVVNGIPLDVPPSLNSRLAIDDIGNVHIVWTNWSKGGHHPEAFYARSTDEGLTFEAPRLISPENATSAISVDSTGRLHLLLHGTDWRLYHLVSENAGESFEMSAVVTDPDIMDQTGYHYSSSGMVIDMQDNIHVIWLGIPIGASRGGIFYSKSTDGGVNFQTNVLVDKHMGGPEYPGLDTDRSGNPHVIWIDSIGWEKKMYYSHSVDGGKTFKNRIFLRRGGEISGSGHGLVGPPRLRIGQDGTPRIAWVEYFETSRDRNIWMSKMDFVTQTLFQPLLITDDLRNDTAQGQLSFALDGSDTAHAVWMDDRDPIDPELPGVHCYDVYYAKSGKGRAAIISYQWDIDSYHDSDGDGNLTNDVDATGSTPTVTYGDDGFYTVTLKVTDEIGSIDYDSANVTVLNVIPTVSSLTHKMGHVDVSIHFRIAGEKWHNVEVQLFEDEIEIGHANITRHPGSPNDQMISLANISADLTKTYSAIAYYTPEDDPINGQTWGATPAWFILKFDNEERRIHQTFNVRQEDTWVWNAENLNQYFPFAVSFEAVASDPGSDDLTFTWDWGDGTSSSRTYYNDGIGPDPYPSPDVNPITIADYQEHVFPSGGTYTILLTVEDDDGGSATTTSLTEFVLSLLSFGGHPVGGIRPEFPGVFLCSSYVIARETSQQPFHSEVSSRIPILLQDRIQSHQSR